MAKNYKIAVIVLLISIVLISACTPQQKIHEKQIVDNAISIVESEQNTGLSFQSLQFDSNGIDEVLTIVENSIIYCQYQNDGADIVYYKYDIKEKVTYELGRIQNPNINSGSIARIGSKLYFYMNEIVRDSQSQTEQIEASLYEIDLENNSMRKITTETVNQTLIYVDILSGNVISFKGKLQDSIALNYIDVICVDDTKEPEIIISAEYDNALNCGNIIDNISQSNGSIYVLHKEIDNSGIALHTIVQYDNYGNPKKTIELDSPILDIIENERISRFEIMGAYAFIRTFSGAGVLCDISNDVATVVHADKGELDIAYYARASEEPTYSVVFSRNTGEVRLFDIKSGELSSLDVEFDNLEYVFIDDTTNILLSAFNGDNRIIAYLDCLDIHKK